MEKIVLSVTLTFLIRQWLNFIWFFVVQKEEQLVNVTVLQFWKIIADSNWRCEFNLLFLSPIFAFSVNLTFLNKEKFGFILLKEQLVKLILKLLKKRVERRCLENEHEWG